MDKVYVVYWDTYDDGVNIYGVFSSIEKATQWIAEHFEDWEHNTEIEEYTIDERLATSIQKTLFRVSVEVTAKEVFHCVPYLQPHDRFLEDVVFTNQFLTDHDGIPDKVYLYIKAENKDKAIEKAISLLQIQVMSNGGLFAIHEGAAFAKAARKILEKVIGGEAVSVFPEDVLQARLTQINSIIERYERLDNEKVQQ